MARTSVGDTGTLGDVPFADLLQHLEASGKAGEVRLDTRLGSGRIWFRDGSVIDAEMGDSTGEAAVFRLMAAAEGSYAIEYKPIARLQAINESSAALVGRRQRRADEWQGLVEQMPSLDAVLALNVARYEALRAKLPPVDAEILALVDGRRTIVDIVDESGFDAVAALERLAWYIRARLIRPAGSSSVAPPPVAPKDDTEAARERLNALGRDLLGDGGGLGPRDSTRSRRDSDRPPGRSRTSSNPPTRRSLRPEGVRTRDPRVDPDTAPPPRIEQIRTDRLKGRSSSEPPRPESDRPRERLASEPPRPEPSDRSRSQGSDRPRSERPSESPSVRSSDGTDFRSAAFRSNRATLRMASAPPPPVEPVPQDPPRGRMPSIVPAKTVPVVGGEGGPGKFGVAPPGRRSLSPARTQIGLMPPEPGKDAAPGTVSQSMPEGESGTLPMLPPARFPEPETWPGSLPPIPRDSAPPALAVRQLVTTSEPPPSTRLEEKAPPAEPRTVLGRYEILSRIARGGMGTVYLCRVTGEGGFRRLFALKVLRRHLSRDRAAAEMFLQEAQVAARIYDPHVVGIVDVGTYGTQPYIVMDYVEGASLHELLQRHPRYRPPRLIVPIILDALAGLHAAHTLREEDGTALRLVHCDVSPHNVLVGIDGTGRISDFGIAKAAAIVSDGSPIATRGKPAYLAPEQAMRRPIDHRADIFALGVILWNALTGERLFEGESISETVDNVLSKPISPPSKVGMKPPPALDPICLKALARDPDERYQSAEEMMHDLRRVALREDLLGSSNDVARWVTRTFGPELQARRLAALDASRRARTAETSRQLPEVERLSDPPPPPEQVSDAPPSSDPPSSDEYSRTIVLKAPDGDGDLPIGRIVIAAAVVSVIAVIAALLFPDRVARLFRIDPDAPLPPSTFARSREIPPAPPGVSGSGAATLPVPGSH